MNRAFLAAALTGLVGLPGAADTRPGSDALREWSPCLSEVGASLAAGKGPWRLVAATLEPDSNAPLCPGGPAFCPGAPLSGGAGSIVFRFVDESGARLCPPAVRGKVTTTDGDSLTLAACEDTPEGPVQRFAMLGTAFPLCAGGGGTFSATVDEFTNDGLYADAVNGLGLPNGRPVNIVLTWQRNPPFAAGPRFPNTPGCTTITGVGVLPDGAVGQPYSATFTAVGDGSQNGICWDIINGDEPPGLDFTFDQGTFTISGAPTKEGTFSFTVAAFGGACGNFSCSDQKNQSVKIGPAGSVTEPPPQYGGGNNPRANAAPGGDGGSSSSEGIKGGGCWAGAVGASPLAAALAAALAGLAAARRRGRRP